MKIEDIQIEDAADANYVIKKFFNNDFKNIKMAQLEELVLTVYSMGKNSGASGGSDSKPAEPPPPKVSPFKMNDRVKILEDVEIGHSGEIVEADNEGTVTLVKGDTVTVLFEAGEEGEMIEVSVPVDKLEKVS